MTTDTLQLDPERMRDLAVTSDTYAHRKQIKRESLRDPYRPDRRPCSVRLRRAVRWGGLHRQPGEVLEGTVEALASLVAAGNAEWRDRPKGQVR